MEDYNKQEGHKFFRDMIIIIIVGLFISGLIDQYEERKYNAGYDEGYQQALDDYGVDK